MALNLAPFGRWTLRDKAGQVEWGRYFAAQQDACFAAFKASIPGVVPPRRGRPGKRGSHANGGQNAA
ncbi:hypothetical protein [Thauera chlorobenzoica]|uniref:hypothetical protein n=1 Tax=Thauera chlorobenzoica TaxID=96773 RepID=UPI0012F4E352|nr:hypothetical protein [Thauera chlorobenzoica]